MKRICLLSFVCLAAGLVSATPSVVPGSVTVSQDADTHALAVRYVLADGPAIVTFELKRGGETVDAGRFLRVTGDVNKLVSGDAEHGFVVEAADDLGALTVTVEVSAWDVSDPPDYMVADLMVPNTVNYYASSNAIPGGLFGNDANFETRMVFKRVFARGQTFTMGSPTTESGRGSNDREAQHQVTLTKDFYLGVFEVTQAQFLFLKGGVAAIGTGRAAKDTPFYFYNEALWAHRPADNVSYNEIRHSATKAGNDAARYPNGPGEGSWLKAMRDRTGLAVDLPGEAQWEYACKAGTGDKCWNNGKSFSASIWNASICNGRVQQTGGGTKNSTSQGDAYTNGTAVVGSYEPSLWGFYDMHGNVAEFCVDWYAADITGIGDDSINADGAKLKDGTTDGTYRIARGGHWWQNITEARTAARSVMAAESGVDAGQGFRVMAPIPNPVE